MSRRWFVAALVAAALTAPQVARASVGWIWPVAGEPSLRFGASYVATDGRTCTHGGLDIAAEPGSTVRAAVPGEVVFSGLVPAGEGARAWAVTVLTADGLRVTYLPLSSAGVRRGQTVAASQGLGVLSGAGDASGGATHLHLSVKRGDVSLDPLAFLGARIATPPEVRPPAPAGPAPGGGARTGGSVPGRSSATAWGTAPAAAPVPGRFGVPLGAGVAGVTPAEAVQGALRALAAAPPLTRVEAVASPPVLDVARVSADWDAARGVLLAAAVRLGLLVLAAGCAWPVLRAARSAGARAALEPARRGRR
jgi:hypothetical protein